MAEGLLRAIYGDRYEAYSAGIEATSVNPYAVVVMKEIGIDISSQRSKTHQEFQDTIFDLAVTVCDRAKVACLRKGNFTESSLVMKQLCLVKYFNNCSIR
ncbi:arsenate reductase ArsC [Methanosarcina sp. UBA5]|uniref:arsenate reductase ArsC n=1 Tax=Methanosarcina sp. UBA5 TaxID=1915593 RepID=UPI0025EE1A76|nr:arsenate reductase ArsC [Methanosarcina sp. UBA5]